jgi:hypothetical protein
MTYLDVNPVIGALRTTPNAFEFTGGALHHIPSRHFFYFETNGRVRMAADCACAYLAIKEEQQATLTEAFLQWRVNYWRPLEINKQFAEHFNPPSGWRRVLLLLTERLQRALLTQSRQAHAHQKAATLS